ncbi:uncharacterized protein LOC108604387 [Drosophila busckii]|uniref:uncharacterized protein LOC108604387 n=1 Tax=Drosophila busckii TaxID=30019 RepID=UPI001432F5D1|nr:uncharacterized protein LOC108604387 [Drosophila busckii]
MGRPELPGDCGEDPHFQTPTIEHPHIQEQSEDSDDSNAYDGYQPLAMDVEESNAGGSGSEPEHIDDADIDLTTAPVTHGDPNMPPIESADVEIERQVWSEPRPQELQLELDKSRTEQILKAMSKITLPNVTLSTISAPRASLRAMA